MNLGEWEVVLKVKFHWLEFKVLKIPPLYEEAFQETQALSGQVLWGRWEKRKGNVEVNVSKAF